MPAALIGGGALSELAYEASRCRRCGTLLLYGAPELWGSGFRILALNCGGAMGIRTPDLLHAIQWRPAHRSPLAQVTVPPSTHQSTGIQTRCGTSLLYGPMPPTACSSAESCSGQRREIPCCHAPDFTHLPMTGNCKRAPAVYRLATSAVRMKHSMPLRNRGLRYTSGRRPSALADGRMALVLCVHGGKG